MRRALEEFDADDFYTVTNLLNYYFAFTDCRDKVIEALDDPQVAGWVTDKKHDNKRRARNTSTHGLAEEWRRHRVKFPEYDFVALKQSRSRRAMVKHEIENIMLPVYENVILPKIRDIPSVDWTLPTVEVEYVGPVR